MISKSEVYDSRGEIVTQSKWNHLESELERLRRAGKARIVRLPEVVRRVGLQKTQIYQLMAAGEFPERVNPSERATGWLEEDIDAYIAKRVGLSRRGKVQ